MGVVVGGIVILAEGVVVANATGEYFGSGVGTNVGLTAGNTVPGGKVGSGAGVGILGKGGPGYTAVSPGLRMCGVTLIMSSLRSPLSV